MAVASRKKKPAETPSSRTVVAAARGKGAGAKRKEPFKLREFIRSILPAIVIFLVIRTFLIEAYRIPSGSMIPTLLIGDFLFVNKLVYGPTIPFTDVHLPGYGEPQRGSVAVYKSPPQYDQPHVLTPTVVKRLVGVAGDTLHMRQGVLYLNGMAQRQGSGTVAPPPGYVDFPDQSFDWQTRVALKDSRFGPAPERPTHDNWGPFVVPAGHYFSLGDNRYDSKDARYYGFIPRENIRGKPLFIYYSHACDEGGPPLLCFLTTIRWSRIGDVVR
jgi:signal peptidase I